MGSGGCFIVLDDFPNTLPDACANAKFNTYAEMEGFYKFDVPLFKSLPEFQWNQLFNLPETKKQKKDREFAEWAESEAKKDVPETKNEWSATMEVMEC